MKHSILIVDDEIHNRLGLSRALSHLYTIFLAENGKEAMDIIEMNGDIRLVVTDMNMPEVDGFELLEKIRAANKKMDVIIVSAFMPFELADDPRELGAFDYMTKPVDLGKLETTIQNAIENEVSTIGGIVS